MAAKAIAKAAMASESVKWRKLKAWQWISVKISMKWHRRMAAGMAAEMCNGVMKIMAKSVNIIENVCQAANGINNRRK